MASQYSHRDGACDVSDAFANGSDTITSSRNEIRTAYTANESTEMHGRSSGSGCCIIRLRGEDAASVRGLVDFADDFFEGVDDDGELIHLLLQ